jgi:hypothetical protein
MKFDFEQEFLPVNYKPLFKIYRFNIYRLTPASLFPRENEQYFSFLDEQADEVAMFGVMFIPNGDKNFDIKTRLLTGRKGDLETFQYVAEAVLDRLSDNIIKDLKNKKEAAARAERNDA